MLLSQAVQHGRRLRHKAPSWLTELGPERTDGVSEVYLLTFARILAQRLQRGGLRDVTQMSRADILDCVLNSWERPLTTSAGGRPRDSEADLVKRVVVPRFPFPLLENLPCLPQPRSPPLLLLSQHGMAKSITCSRTSLSQAGAGCK